MHFSPISLALVAVLPISSAFPITASSVKCRSGPGKNYPVVKTYQNGKDIHITCQATDTQNDSGMIWDKTWDKCYVPDFQVEGGAAKYVNKACDGNDGNDGDDGDDGNDPNDGNKPNNGYELDDGDDGGDEDDGGDGDDENDPNDPNDGDDGDDEDDGGDQSQLPTLSPTQSKYARIIIGEAKKEKLGQHGCEAGIATALVEASFSFFLIIYHPLIGLPNTALATLLLTIQLEYRRGFSYMPTKRFQAHSTSHMIVLDQTMTVLASSNSAKSSILISQQVWILQSLQSSSSRK